MSETAGSTCSPYSVSVASFCIENSAQYFFIFYHANPKIREHKTILGHRNFTIDKYGILYVREIEKETGKVLVDDLRVDVKEL